MTKKRKIFIALAIGIAALAVIMIGGYFLLRAILSPSVTIEYPFSGDGSMHVVTFDSTGGSEVESQTVRDGNLARQPVSPQKSNFTFRGWYTGTDENAELWRFQMDRVYEDVTLYAAWLPADNIAATESLVYERN